MNKPIKVGDSYVRDYDDKVVRTTVTKVLEQHVWSESKVIAGRDWEWGKDTPHFFPKEQSILAWRLACKFAQELMDAKSPEEQEEIKRVRLKEVSNG